LTGSSAPAELQLLLMAVPPGDVIVLPLLVEEMGKKKKINRYAT
jgi:hypothetical protein